MPSVPATIDSSEYSVLKIIDPYHLGSSDNHGSVLVSNVFNGVGFSSWKRSMTIAPAVKNKLSFVDGTITPPIIDSSDYQAWYRVNSMVISWILNQSYEQSNSALIYQIHSQNSDDFSTYYTKLMKIWDELRIIRDVPNCSCGASAKIHKFLEEHGVIQLLMGLIDSYKIISGQILMMQPLPSLSTAYSLIIHEERQRDIKNPVAVNTEAIAMHATSTPLNASSGNSSEKSIVCTH